jgi:D-3-phosphoglycerate dehydrogenase / 2-oxoglutarate reductase
MRTLTRVLAIADQFIPAPVMDRGLEPLRAAGIEVVVREWPHASIEELQRDNLKVELGGPEAVELPPFLFADMARYQGLIVQFAPVSAGVMAGAEGLSLIAVLRSGVENVDAAAAAARGIAVANTPGRNARAVAEFALGLMISETRNIARTHEALRRGVWLKDYPNGGSGIPELYGKTVGLVGFGQVARLLSGFLHAFGCSLLVYDPYFRPEAQSPGAPRVEATDLPTLLRDSDIVSIHARYTEETQGLIGEKEFALMKPSAILVNTARSGLVDQAALVRALRERRITGAAIDVFDREPIPADDEILRLDNITITPHIAGSTRDAFGNSPGLFASMLLAAREGRGGLSIVNGVAL